MMTIEMKKNRAIGNIDSMAGDLRGRFITTTEGQDAVYIEKGKQAQAFANAGFDPLQIDNFLMIKLEADVIGMPYQQFAEIILEKAAEWSLLGAVIEAMRIQHKILVNAAQTETEVDAIMQSVDEKFTKPAILLTIQQMQQP